MDKQVFGNKDTRFKNNAERITYLNQKHRDMAKRQEATLVIDFDKAILENKESIVIIFLNKKYHLPASMPFRFSTFFLRDCIRKVKGNLLVDIPEEKMITFVEFMFGEEFTKVLENSKDGNVTTDLVFKTLVPQILKKWGYNIDEMEATQKKTTMKMTRE